MLDHGFHGIESRAGGEVGSRPAKGEVRRYALNYLPRY